MPFFPVSAAAPKLAAPKLAAPKLAAPKLESGSKDWIARVCLSATLLVASTLAVTIASVVTSVTVFPSDAEAQAVEAPDRKFLFAEDRNRKRERVKRKREIETRQKQIARSAKAKGLPLDINAPNINYDSANKTLHATGGIILSYSTAIVEADEITVGVESKEAQLKGNVKITDPTGQISADEASLNLDKGTGIMKNADIYFEEGNYKMAAREIRKLEGQTFELADTKISTCNCPEET
ncbi:MAG: LPS-assembly protein LptD, partial [Deltaproteobacteria bacterium]|nr:LPS-assembly protein LptD [Deltaproteobacteria bacterium]